MVSNWFLRSFVFTIYLRLSFAADQLEEIHGLGELTGDSLDRFNYSHCQVFYLIIRQSLLDQFCFYQFCS